MVSDLLQDPKRYGPDARLLGKAIREGWISPWKIDPALKETIVSRLRAAIEAGGDVRAMSAMSETARRMAADDAKALIELVKLLRLVQGESTENVSHDVRTRVVVERSDPERMLHDPGTHQEGPGPEPAGAD
jgi:hypothetical protein